MKRYIIETLESIKNQNYKNIELIISDDASLDNTIYVCKEWLRSNQLYFVRAKLMLSDKNSGIAPNCNRGIEEAKGEWIKLVAGDDILFSDSISIFVDYANRIEGDFFFSEILTFSNIRKLAE